MVSTKQHGEPTRQVLPMVLLSQFWHEHWPWSRAGNPEKEGGAQSQQRQENQHHRVTVVVYSRLVTRGQRHTSPPAFETY